MSDLSLSVTLEPCSPGWWSCGEEFRVLAPTLFLHQPSSQFMRAELIAQSQKGPNQITRQLHVRGNKGDCIWTVTGANGNITLIEEQTHTPSPPPTHQLSRLDRARRWRSQAWYLGFHLEQWKTLCYGMPS